MRGLTSSARGVRFAIRDAGGSSLMHIRLSVLAVFAATVFLACDNSGPRAVSPSPTTAGYDSLAAQPAAAESKQHAVSLMDACDPETFNAAIGPGTCIRAGGVRFDNFLDQLRQHGSIGAWHIAPSNVTMKVGQLLVANNRGGEVHTFTEVEEFGGGIVPVLNQVLGLSTVAPECRQLASGDFLAPGASSSEEEEDEGVEKYQCCIHPWMRAEVRISGK
jgi:hypothetical protein